MTALQWTAAPPESGSIRIDSALPRVSLHSAAERRTSLQDVVRAQISGCPYLLTGEVTLRIEWHTDERVRYETGSSPEVEDVVAPILDVLSGPKGLIVDTCQAQSLGWHREEHYAEAERLVVELKFDPVLYCRRVDLFFVEIGGDLCYPIDQTNKEAQRASAHQAARMYRMRDHLLLHGVPYEDARAVLPPQKAFHRQRVRGFRVTSLEKLGPDPAPPAKG